MEFIILFLIIIINSMTISHLLKKKIELAIPISVIIITIIVYVFGLFDNLSMGVIAVEILSTISLIYNIVTIIKAIKNKEYKELLSRTLTPGLFVYMALFLLFIIINHGRIFEDYDEFNHWAVIIKNMFVHNGYGTVKGSIVTFNEYPPFTACFQYILPHIKGEYSEDLVIISQNLLYLSMIIPICKNTNFDKKFRNLLIIVPAILILPLVLYEDFFVNILVDGFLGILFAIGLFIIYKDDENKLYRNIILSLIITALALTKTTGILFSILLLIFAIIKFKQNRIKTILIILALPVILTSAWYIKVNTTQVPNEWDLKSTISSDENSIRMKNSEMIISKFYYALFEQTQAIGERISMLCKILLLSAYSIFVYKTVKDKDARKSYSRILIETIISFVIFAIGLLWMYLTIFIEEEAFYLASYDRYMGTMLLAWLTLNTLIICDESDFKLSNIYIFIVIGLTLLPSDTVYSKYIRYKEYIPAAQIKRNYYYSKFEKYENLFKEDDKIYFISDTNINNIKVLKLHKYEMLTPNIANKEPIFYGGPELLAKTLLEENYTYLYIYKVEDEFIEKYQSLFSTDKIKNETLYKINVNKDGDLKLDTVI